MRRLPSSSLWLATAGLLMTACGGSAESAAPATPAERGRVLADANGCAACHGEDYDGAIGPTWVGLAGSDVPLSDGSTVVADRDYLRLAIMAPDAQIRAGYTLAMPANRLTPDETDAVIDYIESLTS